MIDGVSQENKQEHASPQSKPQKVAKITKKRNSSPDKLTKLTRIEKAGLGREVLKSAEFIPSETVLCILHGHYSISPSDESDFQVKRHLKFFDFSYSLSI